MSFGFGVGDFMAAAELAWNLYRYCYKVAKGAPKEFQILLGEITTLSQSIRLLEEDSRDPNSTLMRAGEDRVRMVKEMMARVEVTLKELQKYAKKYEKLGQPSRKRTVWTKLKWSAAPELDSLRTKRIESTNLRLERRFSEIGDLIGKLGTDGSSAIPTVSAIDDKTPKINLINAVMMKNAEAGQRKWSAIGIDEWIQAGRWWLMKSQMGLAAKPSSERVVPKQGFLDLIKASWILVDVIARHPQLNLLDSGIRYDVEILAETIRSELGNIDTLGLQKPSCDELLEACDLRIWESQTRGPDIQPTVRSSSAGVTNQLWATADEDVLFQRFGHYQANNYTKLAPCVILFLMHRKDKVARIVLGNQSWIMLEQFLVGKTMPSPDQNFVQIENQKIEFSTSLDARHVCAIWEAAVEYLFHCRRNDSEHEILQALTLLFAIRRNYRDVSEKLSTEGSNSGSQLSPSKASPAVRLQLAAEDLGLQVFSGKDSKVPRKHTTSTGGKYAPILRWATERKCSEVVLLLLEMKGAVIKEEDVQEWCYLNNAAACGNTEALKLLLLEDEVDVNTIEEGRHHRALQAAAKGGHEEAVKILLDAGANVNAEAGYINGRTALQAAAEGGHGAVVERLLNAGAEVNAEAAKYEGRTALQAAAEGGHGAVVERLLNAGTEVNAEAAHTNGRTALQAAAEGGHGAVVERLLNAGAEVNAEAGYRDGRTALQAAAEGGHGAVVERLLNASAEVNAEAAHTNGRTALQAAAGGGHGAVVERLREAYRELSRHTFLASSSFPV